MIIGDTFFTLGSANMNQRSMAVDSELNITVVDPAKARDLRERVWGQHSGISNTNRGSKANISRYFRDWVAGMKSNLDKQLSPSTDPALKKMTGFLMPLEDARSSTLRLG